MLTPGVTHFGVYHCSLDGHFWLRGTILYPYTPKLEKRGFLGRWCLLKTADMPIGSDEWFEKVKAIQISSATSYIETKRLEDALPQGGVLTR